MRVTLDQYIFTESPYERFSKQYGVDKKLWKTMYHKKYCWLEYSFEDLAEYLELKARKRVDRSTMKRWVQRTQVFNKAQELRKLGTQEVDISFFGENQNFVLDILNKKKPSLVN